MAGQAKRFLLEFLAPRELTAAMGVALGEVLTQAGDARALFRDSPLYLLFRRFVAGEFAFADAKFALQANQLPVLFRLSTQAFPRTAPAIKTPELPIWRASRSLSCSLISLAV